MTTTIDPDDLSLLATYKDGPRIWDAASLMPAVDRLTDAGLTEHMDGRSARQITQAGRNALAAAATPVITRSTRGADRPSCLVMNPRNVEMYMDHRAAMVQAFRALPDDDQADIMDFLESYAHGSGGGYDPHREDVSKVVHQMYDALGLRCSHS